MLLWLALADITCHGHNFLSFASMMCCWLIIPACQTKGLAKGQCNTLPGKSDRGCCQQLADTIIATTWAGCLGATVHCNESMRPLRTLLCHLRMYASALRLATFQKSVSSPLMVTHAAHLRFEILPGGHVGPWNQSQVHS